MFDANPKAHKKINLALEPKRNFLDGNIKARFVQLIATSNSLSSKNPRILDLSNFSANKFNSFSELGFTSINFSDFYHEAGEQIFEKDQLLTEKGLYQIFFGGMDESNIKKFDVVLCWDILNYLPEVNLKKLTDFLFKYTNNSANLFALIYTSKSIPSTPLNFDLNVSRGEFYTKTPPANHMIDSKHQITSKQLQNFFTPWYLNKISLCHGSIHDVHFTK